MAVETKQGFLYSSWTCSTWGQSLMAYLWGWSSKGRGIENIEDKVTRKSSSECISMSSLLGCLRPRFLTCCFGLRFSCWFLHRQFALEKFAIQGWKSTNLLSFTIWWMSVNHIISLLGNLTTGSPHEDTASDGQNFESPWEKKSSQWFLD